MAKNQNKSIDFDSYYEEIFKNRWKALKEALLQEPYSIKLQFEKDLEAYFMDAASLFAATALPLDKAENVLDLCAAPGGKSLVLSAFLPNEANLLANELSMQRRERLISVLNQSLPKTILEKIKISPYDGSIMYKRNIEYFDAILCDLPCSSERHVLKSPKHLTAWTKGRIKNLSFTQSALISSAFLMLKPSGYLLYATCALTEIENDTVIQKLLKKNPTASVLDLDIGQIKEKILNTFNIAIDLKPEKTQYGYHILPDTSKGAGPLYLSLIQKGIFE